MKLSEQNKIPELEYHRCTQCDCKLDDPNDGEEIIGDGIYCGPYYNNCKTVIKYAKIKSLNERTIHI